MGRCFLISLDRHFCHYTSAFYSSLIMSPVTLWTVSVAAWMVQALILESYILLKVHFVVCGEGKVVIFMAWLNYGSSQSEACIPQLFRPIGSL